MKKFEMIDILWKRIYEAHMGIIICIEGEYRYIFELLIDSGFKSYDILAYYYKNLLEYQLSENYFTFKRICKTYGFLEILNTKYHEYEELKKENWMLADMQTEFDVMLIRMGIRKDSLPIKLRDIFVSGFCKK